MVTSRTIARMEPVRLYSTDFYRIVSTGRYRVLIAEVPTAVAQPTVATRRRVLSIFMIYSSRNLLPGLQLNLLYCSLELLIPVTLRKIAHLSMFTFILMYKWFHIWVHIPSVLILNVNYFIVL